jgi:acyl-CoA reductase-like NAD-dependent aldehyde dehydrogenase
MTTTFTHLIDGALVPGSRHFDVIDPSTGTPFARCPDATRADVDAAMDAAARAFAGAWAHDEGLRRRTLVHMSEALAAKAEEIGRLVCQEQGKPLAAATGEVKGAAQTLKLYADMPIPRDVLRDDAKARVTLVRRPLGVTAAITPWNYPVYTLIVKIAPAFLAGNTVVAKPSPFTPLSSLALGAALRDAVPAGVLNVLGGSDEVGAWMTAHPAVRKISFTGSVPTGKTIARAAADDLKRVTLELGGNDAAIVLDDVDPKAVAPKLFFAGFVNSGQVCMAIKRIYAHESIYEPLCAALAEEARKWKVGDGLDPATKLGPIQNRMQYEKVVSIMEDTKKAGARVLVGGEVPNTPGYFVNPTLVTDVDEDSRLVREEQFGPVVPVLKFKDVEEALKRANDTRYGLSGSVWSRDPERAAAIAARLEVGTAWVNQHRATAANVPFGGAKESGYGRVYSAMGLKAYLEPRVISVLKQQR